jgi:predicted DCC family thiol-disulfide oxidoreductase YuxK
MSPRLGRLKGPDGLMIFDGACNLCSTSVQLVTRMDRSGRIRFCAVQSSYGRSLCEQHGIDPDDPTTFLFFDCGQPLQGSDAIVALLARMPPPWRWLRGLSSIPKPWRDASYSWIARNRYRLFGRRATCMIATPRLKERFVDIAPRSE